MSIKVRSLSTWDHPQFHLLRDIYWQQPWSHAVVLARWWNDYVSRAPWVSLSVLCQREASSHCLVAEDALHCSDIRNSPQGASPFLWLTDQHGKPVLSHNSPHVLCCLWSPVRGFLFIRYVPRCTEHCRCPLRFFIRYYEIRCPFFSLILNMMQKIIANHSCICRFSKCRRNRKTICSYLLIVHRVQETPCDPAGLLWGILEIAKMPNSIHWIISSCVAQVSDFFNTQN